MFSHPQNHEKFMTIFSLKGLRLLPTYILSEDRVFPIFLPSSKNFILGWFIDITSKKNLERKSNQIFWPTKYQHIRERKTFQHQQETKTWSKFSFMVSFDCDFFLLKSRLIFNFFLFFVLEFFAQNLHRLVPKQKFPKNIKKISW